MLLSSLPSFFKDRRDRLMALPGAQGAAFVLPAAPELLRNHDVHHAYRQDSNFQYLTGFEEPESCAVLLPPSSRGAGYRYVLFVRKRDPEKEIWEGERYGIEGALKIFGATEAYLYEELETRLPELLKGVDKVYYRIHQNEEEDRKILRALDAVRRIQGRSGKGLLSVSDPNELLGEMRMYKGPEEIRLMKEACRISALAHKTVMEQVRPGMNEYEVEALIDYVFRKNGCARLGYGSIVAGGKNACCLHYRSNNDVLRDGDLLLIDAAGEYGFYTSDITRTFPVGRSFSKEQAQIYDLTLKAQVACIAAAKPGATMSGIHRIAQETLAEGLLSLGLARSKSVKEMIESAELRRFYPHGTGHFLGMDVHDVGLYQVDGQPRLLEPGMMFTIEPGIYVQPTDSDAPAAYRNIGVRIEDDILITATGCEAMTYPGVPKERGEIEALRAKAF